MTSKCWAGCLPALALLLALLAGVVRPAVAMIGEGRDVVDSMSIEFLLAYGFEPGGTGYVEVSGAPQARGGSESLKRVHNLYMLLCSRGGALSVIYESRVTVAEMCRSMKMTGNDRRLEGCSWLGPLDGNPGLRRQRIAFPRSPHSRVLYLLAWNCGHDAVDLSYNYFLRQPDGTYLSTTLKPLPLVSIVLASVCSLATLASFAHVFAMRSIATPLHWSLLGVTSILVGANAVRYQYWEDADQTGRYDSGFGTGALTLEVLGGTAFLVWMLVASRGLWITRLRIPYSEVSTIMLGGLAGLAGWYGSRVGGGGDILTYVGYVLLLLSMGVSIAGNARNIRYCRVCERVVVAADSAASGPPTERQLRALPARRKAALFRRLHAVTALFVASRFVIQIVKLFAPEVTWSSHAIDDGSLAACAVLCMAAIVLRRPPIFPNAAISATLLSGIPHSWTFGEVLDMPRQAFDVEGTRDDQHLHDTGLGARRAFGPFGAGDGGGAAAEHVVQIDPEARMVRSYVVVEQPGSGGKAGGCGRGAGGEEMLLGAEMDWEMEQEAKRERQKARDRAGARGAEGAEAGGQTVSVSASASVGGRRALRERINSLLPLLWGTARVDSDAPQGGGVVEMGGFEARAPPRAGATNAGSQRSSRGDTRSSLDVRPPIV
ncbi:unnamed protein product [Pedinophyceae sp. YPF-701]|nr:unnamed protein product [Pedinophyceae sp. YPF-701]